MSTMRRPAGQSFSSTTIRWTIYVVIGLSLAGLLLRVTARTVALAEDASLAATAAAPKPTKVVVVVPNTAGPPTETPAPTGTAVPATPTNTPTATQLPGATLTAIYQVNCRLYDQVEPELLTIVSPEVGLPREYEPTDMAIVPLEQKNIYVRPIPLRRVAHQALLDLLDGMNQAGLSVWVASGFRSFGEQQLAYEKWAALYPDRAPDISAVPGHSEHQLGTSVDFSTPYMDDLYSDLFHVNFSTTPEGQWLTKQAAYYGFTLSYPSWGTQETGYAWEPWHFRYVGILAGELLARNITLTHYLKECTPT
jgi:LAS superfamily LD-carboxypeptidase LdcB